MNAKLLLTFALGLAWAGLVSAAPVLQQTAPNPISYIYMTDFSVMQYSGVGDITAGVTSVDLSSSDSGCDAADFAGFPAGNIALIKRGTCQFALKASNAAAAGALGVLIFNNEVWNPTDLLQGTLGSSFPYDDLPVMGLTRVLGEELAATQGLIMRISVQANVPEPGGLALLGLGLATLAWTRKRQR